MVFSQMAPPSETLAPLCDTSDSALTDVRGHGDAGGSGEGWGEGICCHPGRDWSQSSSVTASGCRQLDTVSWGGAGRFREHKRTGRLRLRWEGEGPLRWCAGPLSPACVKYIHSPLFPP